jgi:HK97 gp10 family phage protein
MATGETKVTGFAELFKAMDELSEEIGKAKTDRIWKKALEYAFEPVLQYAIAHAPVDTGQLRDHLYIKAHRPTSRDKQAMSYRGESFMVRMTSGPKRAESVVHTMITKKGKEKSLWENRPVALANEFGTARNPAQPFIRPALESNIQNVQDRLGKAIWYELEWGKWAKKG